MYHKGLVGAGTGVAALPFTGFDIVWLALGAFALLMAAGAVWRMIPRGGA